jgi:predicted enzyme related to lactoylglutathione lyase
VAGNVFEGKISQVTLVVRDQAAALDFYTNKVGFEKKTDVSAPGGYRWVTVGPKDQDLELALYQSGSNADPQLRARESEWRPGSAPPIVVRVADCRKMFAELSSRGVSFLQPPKEYPWGIAATFGDPDANLFSLSQPPVYPPRK